MALVLSEDQQLLKDSAKNFCEQNAPVSVLRGLRDSKDEQGYDQTIWSQMIDLGWAGMAIPEAYGGFDFGYGGLGVVLAGATAIVQLGSETQKQDLLPKIVAGELLTAIALDEHASHHPSKIATTATRIDGGYSLNGSKTFVLDGHIANMLIVVARTSGEADSEQGISLFLVDANAKGLNVARTIMVDSRNSSNIQFNNVAVAEDALLGELDQGFNGLDTVLDIARIGIAAEMLGSMQTVFESILEFLKQREQFGVLIGSFQGLQHRAAEMYSEIELCKSSVRAALAGLDDPNTTQAEIAGLASMTKAKLSEVFFLVSNEGIQMHGGIGMTDEFDVGFFLKRARVAQQFLGDASFHRDRYATLNGF
jgi:alkylation response protein AidB-like acyl-CoA dehydrogenase